MNPLLPRKYFVPDAEARVMPDGRLYLYGSLDISGNRGYCSEEYRVFSTDDPAMTRWTDHGVSFRNTKEEPGIPWKGGVTLYAPDAVYKDGKYYLFICGADKFEAVAVSDTPYGPFGDAKPVAGADGDGIDPSVFVDDDGQAYYLWGQFSLKGAKLNDDMCTLDMDSLHTAILTEQEYGFHEGASIRKRNGKYYIVYTDISRGKATCMSYAVADHPLGPYTKGGVIVDNMYCDPSTWNNHGSIQQFNGQWYIFYHRSSQNGNTCRRVCAEPITFAEDGSIREVVMTSQGAAGPLDAFGEIDASTACRMTGNIYIKPDGVNPDEPNEILTDCGGKNWCGDWAEYRYLDFGEGALSCTVNAKGRGKILLRIDGAEKPFCTVDIDSENGFSSFTAPVTADVSGVHPLWIVFNGRGMELDSFTFAKKLK
ncbi:MAG: family 43 glycosylhydrolase [Clostridia bacterium]|nr:family 43 glycosylhydrolase [Clostridia bacterium]